MPNPPPVGWTRPVAPPAVQLGLGGVMMDLDQRRQLAGLPRIGETARPTPGAKPKPKKVADPWQDPAYVEDVLSRVMSKLSASSTIGSMPEGTIKWSDMPKAFRDQMAEPIARIYGPNAMPYGFAIGNADWKKDEKELVARLALAGAQERKAAKAAAEAEAEQQLQQQGIK